jgi:hypothetical protein
LERFVETDLKEGPRFKIVKRTDKRVEQPNDSECGSIEVRMYLEKEKQEVTVVQHQYLPNQICTVLGHCSICCSSYYCSICHPHRYKPHWDTTPIWIQHTSGGINQTYDSTIGNSVTGFSVGSPMRMSAMAMNNVTLSTKSVGEDAATIKGTISNQTFVPVSVDVDTSDPVTLRINLRGITKQINKCECGTKRRSGDKHCSQCGAQLVYA